VKPIFESPATCLITEGNTRPGTFLQKKKLIIETVRKAVSAGVSIIQIREKQLTTKQIFEIASEAARITKNSNTLLLVNERFDVALAAGIDGVHLSSTSMNVGVVRSNTPSGFVIGVSTHSSDEILRARDEGADYVVFGPVFPTPGKASHVGVGELKRVCQLVAPFPVLALGGIEGSNARSVVAAGAAGFAAIRFLNGDAGLEFAREMRNAN
jgi:thiamine-phosphate pyrophosphorylase